MDKSATIKKTVRLIEQAAKDDVKLLVFPETFIPGYPVRVSALNLNLR
jgi:predicted amidohydrolase